MVYFDLPAALCGTKRALCLLLFGGEASASSPPAGDSFCRDLLKALTLSRQLGT